MFVCKRIITRPDQSVEFWLKLPHPEFANIKANAIATGQIVSTALDDVDSLTIHHYTVAPTEADYQSFMSSISLVDAGPAYHTLHNHTTVITFISY
jgi:hypothetical protein